MLITLCILETLKRCSSEEVTSETHPMTQKEIRKKIEEDYPLLSETVTAKKVRTRLEELIAAEMELKEEENRAIGYHEEVGEKRTIRTRYYLKNAISDMELKYLVDSVMYGKIFNTEQAEDLAHRIQNMSGKKLKNMTPYVNSTFGKQRYQLDI